MACQSHRGSAFFPTNSTSHQALPSARGAGPARQRDKSRSPRLWGEMLQYCVIHLVEVRFLFFSSLMTVGGLTCNTRAVSRIPLAFIAISTICCLTSGDWPV